MNGGPSQMDLFDPKPILDRHHGENYFDKIAGGQVENPQSAGISCAVRSSFNDTEECGAWVSNAMPTLAQCVDDWPSFVRCTRQT